MQKALSNHICSDLMLRASLPETCSEGDVGTDAEEFEQGTDQDLRKEDLTPKIMNPNQWSESLKYLC
jgi:hypothetical protein